MRMRTAKKSEGSVLVGGIPCRETAIAWSICLRAANIQSSELGVCNAQ
jgi:hypothetical protein